MCLLKPEAILIQLNKKIKKCYNFYKICVTFLDLKKFSMLLIPTKLGYMGVDKN